MSTDSISINSKHELDDDSTYPVSKVRTFGDNNEYVILGNKKYLRKDLLESFGGTMDVGLHKPREFGNATCIGLVSFSISNLVLSLYGLNTRGIHTPNVIVSLCIFYAGLLQILASIWDFFRGNTFSYVAFGSYGAFFLSFGAIQIESFGIVKAYMTEDPTQLENAIGIYLIGWALVSFMLLMCTLKSVVSLVAMFFFIFMTFLLQGIGYLIAMPVVIKAGAGVGIAVSVCGLYNAYAGMANKTNSYFSSYLIPLAMHHSH
ncbi:mug86 [Candida jiufengensis]|uniref:mug86 n=1 Tax=Candida jiufengensis TaxID=497108 RepID=UPI00222475CF|nr:mug86 [Candida jiufengensis]KAI5950882.1 mug86 [Candida jiufengensis]